MTTATEETIARLKERAEEEKDEGEATSKAHASREYIVLSLAGGKQWTEVTRAQALSAEAAIKSLGDSLKNESTYVAVPARNWNPVTVAIETKTTLTLK